MIGLIALGLILIGIFVWALLEEKKKEKAEQKRADEFPIRYINGIFIPTLQHIDSLIAAYQNGRYIGNYGELIDTDWQRELKYFIDVCGLDKWIGRDGYCLIDLEGVPRRNGKIFKLSDFVETEFDLQFQMWFERPFYAGGADELEEAIQDRLEYMVENIVEFFADDLQTNLIQKKSKNPLDYEKQIANKLKQSGFNAHATKGSGDQGADVLADKNGVKFAIQCKMYSKPVGNKAVQEANTARDFYKCDYAVVVTNAGYTKSARQAANACNVILLNENQLDKLEKYTE